MRFVLTVVSAALLLLVGCGGDRSPVAAPQVASPSLVIPAKAVDTSAPARVSYATVCPDLIKHGQATVGLVGEFLDNPQRLADGGAATTARFDAVIADWEYDRDVAPEALVPFIEAQIKTTQYLRDYLQVGGARRSDFREFRSSGAEIANQCLSNSWGG